MASLGLILRDQKPSPLGTTIICTWGHVQGGRIEGSRGLPRKQRFGVFGGAMGDGPTLVASNIELITRCVICSPVVFNLHCTSESDR